jgi:hypothetical protein
MLGDCGTLNRMLRQHRACIMDDNSISPDPPTRPRSLREACRQVGLDRGGARCPTCPLRELCEHDERWMVRRPVAATLH